MLILSCCSLAKLFPPQNPSSGVEILLDEALHYIWNLSTYETLSVDHRVCTSSQHITNNRKGPASGPRTVGPFLSLYSRQQKWTCMET